MNSEASQSPNNGECKKCGQQTENLLLMSCSHTLCPKCLTFVYHKFKITMPRPDMTHCPLCSKVCLLQDQQLKAINDFTDHVLVPLMREEDDKKSNHSRQMRFPPDSGQKQTKSHDHSTEKVTPGGRGIRSKCESPKTFGKDCCWIHPDQELSVVCFTCNNSLLCLNCLSSKKHLEHNVKTIDKGLQIIYEQLALTQLKEREQYDELELLKKRLEDRRTVVQERWDRTNQTLKTQFHNLLQLVKRTSQNILQKYYLFFQKIMTQTLTDVGKVEKYLQTEQIRLQKIEEVANTLGTLQTIKKSTQLMNQLHNRLEPSVNLTQIPVCDSETLKRGIAELCDQVIRLENGSARLVNAYRSEEKIKDTVKRTKTNMVSLNSSRDKRQKKCTRTQQDEKKFKSKCNYKTESSSKLTKINKAIPNYLLHTGNRENPLPECLSQFNPLQCSFKSSSKLLSKSHLPTCPEQRKKKEHVAQIKERLERKTFNGTTKQMRATHDGMRKKKIHN